MRDESCHLDSLSSGPPKWLSAGAQLAESGLRAESNDDERRSDVFTDDTAGM